MEGRKLVSIILISLFAIIIFLVSIFGLFNIWLFIGLLFLGSMYSFGYFYIVNHYEALAELDRLEKDSKKKFVWCWNKANEALKQMADGQTIVWDKGTGRRTKIRGFHNGVSLVTYRSMEGYLSNTRQLVVIIFNVDTEDIAEYYANPSADVLQDHFYGFKPYQSREQHSYNNISSRNRRKKGISIHVGDDDQYEDFDNMSKNLKPSDDLIQAGVDRLNNNG